MSLLSYLPNKLQRVIHKVTEGATWLLQNPLLTAIRFSGNTAVRALEGGIALRDAIPNAIYNPAARKIMNGMATIAYHGILPGLLVQYANNTVQNYFRDDDPDGQNANMAYSAYIAMLSVGYPLFVLYSLARQAEVAANPNSNYSPPTHKIMHRMATLASYGVVPAITAQYINNTMQNYFGNGNPDEHEAMIASSALISVLSVFNNLAALYTLKNGIEISARVFATDALAASALNSHKIKLPQSLCTQEQCSSRRFYKGMVIRDPLVFAAVDALGALTGFIPIIGSHTSLAIRIVNAGQFIGTNVTSERCDAHRGLQQEFVVAWGGLYMALCTVIDQSLSAYVGPVSYLYKRALYHMVLTSLLAVAAQTHVPLIANQQQQTIPFDVLNYYQRGCRFLINSLIAGMIKRFPLDFELQPGNETLVLLLQSVTKAMDSDLEKPPTASEWPLVEKSWGLAKPWILPSPFLGVRHFLTNDDAMKIYWPDIRSQCIAFLQEVEEYRPADSLLKQLKRPKGLLTLGISSKGIAKVLKKFFGIPEEICKSIGHDDFWKFVASLQALMTRCGVEVDSKLAIMPHAIPLADHATEIQPLPATVERVQTSSDSLLPADEFQQTTLAVVNTGNDLLSEEGGPMSVLDDPSALLPEEYSEPRVSKSPYTLFAIPGGLRQRKEEAPTEFTAITEVGEECEAMQPNGILAIKGNSTSSEKNDETTVLSTAEDLLPQSPSPVHHVAIGRNTIFTAQRLPSNQDNDWLRALQDAMEDDDNNRVKSA